MTPEQAEWLIANRATERDGGRWVASENHQPMLHELRDAGLMQPAYGEFVMRPAAEPPEEVRLLGNAIPIMGTMISLYMLTRQGRAALSTHEGAAA